MEMRWLIHLRIGCHCVPVVVGIAAITSSCGTASTGNAPFLIPEEQFHLRVTRLIVAPTVVEAGVEVPEPVLRRVDSLVADRLTIAGFFVVPSTAYAEIWMRVTEEAGGFYDPFSGERDERRFSLAVDVFRGDLHDRFRLDAIAYPEIRATEAEISEWVGFGLWGAARWDGITVRAPFGGNYVNAVSVAVGIEDIDGNLLFERSGGIAVTERWAAEAVEMVRVSPDDVFGDDERLTRAVEIALQPLHSGRE